MTSPCCRSCGSASLQLIIDLGLQPLANNLLRPDDLAKLEPKFPLDVHVCTDCWLLQITHIVPPVDLFSDYVYFSSFSDHLLRHSRVSALRYIEEKPLNAGSFVVEVASNDGYLLKNFVEAGVPCLGFEPAANIAEVARTGGVETHCEFFGERSAAALRDKRGAADLILANNVFAHAPETNDFVAGLQTLLRPDGWVVLEFPYGVEMIEKVEFDTIYHEHVFYFTLTPLAPLFHRHGLEIFQVERLPIHGGSLRIFAGHAGAHAVQPSVAEMLAQEHALGVDSLHFYEHFARQVQRVKTDLLQFLCAQKNDGKSIAAYGASAKGSTLLNYCGLGDDLLDFVADRSTYKQGRLTPGTHLPIVGPEQLVARQPDCTVLLTWNFADEILAQQQAYSAAGGKFVVPIPRLAVL